MFFSKLLELLVSPDLWQATLEFGALLLLPALGGVISENSGVTNIAMEGMMLTGAFFGAIISVDTHSFLWGTLAAIIAGGAMSWVHAYFSIRFKANQIVSGIAINIAATGLTGFLLFTLTNGAGVSALPQNETLPSLGIRIFNNVPVIGWIDTVLLQQNIVFYLAIAALIAIQYLLYRTNIGLRIRSVGEHPQAADTAGINVQRIRYWCVVTSGLLSGLAGAYLSLGIAQIFNPNMTAGRGFIALAAVVFGKWKPRGTAIACLIFGLGQALQNRLQLLPTTGIGVIDTPLHSVPLVSMIPYLLTILALVGLVGRAVAPAADGLPYEPGGE